MAIKDSLCFSYDNIYSYDMGIINVNVEQGMVNEPFLANSRVNEVKIRGNDTPYFQDLETSSLTLTLTFAFVDAITEVEKRNVAKWLRQNQYKDLYFTNNTDRIFRCICINGSDFIHNCNNQGYITIQMKCDSPYSYSGTYISPVYSCSGTTNIQLENAGDVDLFPEISILKSGAGDIQIYNQTNGNELFEFTGLSDNEDLYIDNEKEVIVTDIIGTYRYSNFNDNYLKLVYGVNNLQVVGDADIQFRYKNKTLQG